MRYLAALLLLLATPAYAGDTDYCKDSNVPLSPEELRAVNDCVRKAVASTTAPQQNATMMDCMRQKIVALRGCAVGDTSDECNANKIAQGCSAPAMPSGSQQGITKECHREILARRTQLCGTAKNELPPCQKKYREEKAKCEKTFNDKVQISRDVEEISDDFLPKAHEEFEKCVNKARDEYSGCIDAPQN